MASNLRELRERRNSVATTKKITRAMELIASSRIIKAQNTVKAAGPYSLELTRALSAVAAHTHEEHPLTSMNPDPKRSAVLVITSDRGLAGEGAVLDRIDAGTDGRRDAGIGMGVGCDLQPQRMGGVADRLHLGVGESLPKRLVTLA